MRALGVALTITLVGCGGGSDGTAKIDGAVIAALQERDIDEGKTSAEFQAGVDLIAGICEDTSESAGAALGIANDGDDLLLEVMADACPDSYDKVIALRD